MKKKGKNFFKSSGVGRLYRRNRPESRFYDPVATLLKLFNLCLAKGFSILIGNHKSPTNFLEQFLYFHTSFPTPLIAGA